MDTQHVDNYDELKGRGLHYKSSIGHFQMVKAINNLMN